MVVDFYWKVSAPKVLRLPLRTTDDSEREEHYAPEIHTNQTIE
jgi:hypothetical protein